MPEIAVILPTLNERENLAPMIARIDVALAGIDWEAIVVDDDSPDGTAQEARARSLPLASPSLGKERPPSYLFLEK